MKDKKLGEPFEAWMLVDGINVPEEIYFKKPTGLMSWIKPVRVRVDFIPRMTRRDKKIWGGNTKKPTAPNEQTERNQTK